MTDAEYIEIKQAAMPGDVIFYKGEHYRVVHRFESGEILVKRLDDAQKEGK